MWLHVHVGPSEIALALVLPACADAGFATCLVGRPNGNESQTYVRWVAGALPDPLSLAADRRSVRWACGPSGEDDLPSEVRTGLRERPPVLITCSLRAGIIDREALVDEMLLCRPAGAETLFLACENDPHVLYEKIADRHRARGVRTVRTIVNRVALEPIDHPNEAGVERNVITHDSGEWLLERPTWGSAVLTRLDRSHGGAVRVVDGFDRLKDRKIWLVNGGHVALALMALEAPSKSLRKWATDERVLAELRELHGEMILALSCRHGEAAGDEPYGVEQVQVFCELDDRVTRVLASFRRSDLRPMIIALAERIVAPAEVHLRHRGRANRLLSVLDRFEVAIERRSFMDLGDLQRRLLSLSAAADQEIVDAYAVLVSRCCDSDEARARVSRVEAALGEQRLDYSV